MGAEKQFQRHVVRSPLCCRYDTELISVLTSVSVARGEGLRELLSKRPVDQLAKEVP